MSYFIFLLPLAYCLSVLLLIVGWKRVKGYAKVESLEGDFISVLIPVRNEENNIINCLQSLAAQHYRNFEVVIIDDHSTDKTQEIIRSQLNAGKLPIRLYSMNEEGGGKKRALDLGVAKAAGSIIVTTDADCVAGVYWLDSIRKLFINFSVKMVTGGVAIREQSTLFSRIQSMEFSSLVGVGAITLNWNLPTMCNGANLAFRKEVFQEVDGYNGNFEVPSGDDEFLMKKVFKQFPKGVIFNCHPSSVVTTLPQNDFKDFFYQRIRWAGKWRLGSVFSKLIAVFIFLSHVGIVGVIIVSLFKLIAVWISVSLLVTKMVLEFIFIKRVMDFLKAPFRWEAFVLLQLVYPLYVIIFALAANLSSFEWKGRKLNKIASLKSVDIP